MIIILLIEPGAQIAMTIAKLLIDTATPNLSSISNLFTIFGVISAVAIYFFWRRDHRIKVAYEYAVNLLKMVKHLHMEIESLRSAKFYNPDTLEDDIKNTLIPKIESAILKKLININVELLVARDILIKNNDLQEIFIKKIQVEVTNKISSAVYNFYVDCQRAKETGSKLKVNDTELYKILYPFEVAKSSTKHKKSTLGTGATIMNDAFNIKIEENFSEIYDQISDNLMNKKSDKSSHRKFNYH